MATAENMRFHEAGRLQMIRDVKNKIAFGTKASSPAALARNAYKKFYGYRTTNPAGQTVFFVNPDQTNLPFSTAYRGGGAPQNFPAVKTLLQRRAQEFTNIALEKQGAQPVEKGLLEFSTEESRSLELNNLLQQISDAIDAGEISVALTSELKNALRLLSSLLPTLSNKELVTLSAFMGDMIETLRAKENKTASDNAVLSFIEKLRKVVDDFMPFEGSAPVFKIARAKAVIKNAFGLQYNVIQQEGAIELGRDAEQIAQQIRPAYNPEFDSILKTEGLRILQEFINDADKDTLDVIYATFAVRPRRLEGVAERQLRNNIMAIARRNNGVEIYYKLVSLGEQTMPELLEAIDATEELIEPREALAAVQEEARAAAQAAAAAAEEAAAAAAAAEEAAAAAAAAEEAAAAEAAGFFPDADFATAADAAKAPIVARMKGLTREYMETLVDAGDREELEVLYNSILTRPGALAENVTAPQIRNRIKAAYQNYNNDQAYNAFRRAMGASENYAALFENDDELPALFEAVRVPEGAPAGVGAVAMPEEA